MKQSPLLSAIDKRLLTGLWLLLLFLALAFIYQAFHFPTRRAAAAEKRLLLVRSQLITLQAIISESILQAETYDYLQTLYAGDSCLDKAAESLAVLKEQLAYFSSIRRLNRNRSTSMAMKDIQATTEEYSGLMTELCLSFQERGNHSTGLVSKWLALSNEIAETAGENEITSRAIQSLKMAETDYLLKRDSRILSDIAMAAENLRLATDVDNPVFSPATLDAYMSLVNRLTQLDKQLGSETNPGLTSRAVDSRIQLDQLWNRFGTAANKVLRRQARFYSFAGFGVMFIVFLFTLAAFIHLERKLVSAPLQKLAEIAGGLQSGREDIDLPTEGLLHVTSLALILGRLRTSLGEKLMFTRALNQGNLELQLKANDPNDQLGSELLGLRNRIAESVKQQEINEKENLRRRYMNEGLARFAEIMRANSNNFAELGDAFIRELVKYLNAVQGGFFLRDNTPGMAGKLELTAAFAYDRKKYLEKTIAVGEGLVGTCAIEKQTIYLTEIPEGYITITSGLGDTRPDHLLLVPVLHEKELIGVLEIATLKAFGDHEIRFVETVAKNLGSTIIYTRTNQQTAELLAKSQQQAQEMAEQEEEMRQNMEELQATQEESARREEELRGISEAVSSALYVIEYDLDGMVTQINEKLAVFLGRDRNEVNGLTHNDLMGGSLMPDLQFWNTLSENQQVLMHEVVKIGRKEYPLLAHFVAVRSREGFVTRFVGFMTEIPSEFKSA